MLWLSYACITILKQYNLKFLNPVLIQTIQNKISNTGTTLATMFTQLFFENLTNLSTRTLKQFGYFRNLHKELECSIQLITKHCSYVAIVNYNVAIIAIAAMLLLLV